MSPEQAVGERVDRRSDIFAMGLILYESLLGKRAFDKGNDTRTMEAIVNEPLRRPHGIADDHWRLIDRALSKNPPDRFRDAMALKEALLETIPPASDHEIGALVRDRFADRVAQFQKWDAMA
jgi:serine/threonine-protein kinase